MFLPCFLKYLKRSNGICESFISMKLKPELIKFFVSKKRLIFFVNYTCVYTIDHRIKKERGEEFKQRRNESDRKRYSPPIFDFATCW